MQKLYDVQNVTFFLFNEIRGDIKSSKNIKMEFINVKNCY